MYYMYYVFLCVIIPNIFLHKMERNSLIERIKKER